MRRLTRHLLAAGVDGLFPVGSLYCQMGGNECDIQTVRDFDKIVVDNWPERQHREIPVLARARAQGIISDTDIYAELGNLLNGHKPGRASSRERIFFGAVGMGIEDIAIATRILRRAEAECVGTRLDLWDRPVFV